MTTQSRRPKGEGSIFQRADGRWIGRITYDDPATGLRKRSQVSGDTKKAASDALKKIRERVEKKQPPRDDTATFGSFAEQWISSSLEVSDRKQSTKTLYAGLTRSHVIDSDLGRSPMNRIKASTVERFITQLRGKGLSDSTVRQVYTVARGIGDAAVRDRLITENPFGQVKRPKVEHREAAVLTVEEARVLVTEAGGSRYALLFELLINTGLRRGEALALKWSDVDLEGRTARVRKTLVRQGGDLIRTAPKSKKSDRTIPLSAAALDVLRRTKKRNAEDRLKAGSKWHETGYVFVTEFGEPCDPRNALRALQVAAERADLPGVGLHTLRHTAATMMLNAGIPMATVSRIMGHASIAVTVDLYGHVSPDVARDAFDALGAAWTASADG
ncbi:site-specific integrase [Nocardioides sp. JQ2195]|uniref:tyrosine-type recombinase/integrase n=1 Tax=Nocardioides sp. JQ2195 TaxID=2592334 RepID=UPI00143E2CB2|nr:site-specific integrase [Nocardioides sp. JQ2195]QIX27513.1 site-specific integrase [Nocardioides sp. JQ2195]